MRISIIALNFSDYSIQLANAFSQQSNEVQIILRDITPKEVVSLIRNDILTIYYKERRTFNPANILMIRRILREIKKFKPDIVHVQGGGLWFCQLYRFLGKFPIVVTVHDPVRHKGEEKFHTRITNNLNKKYARRFIVHGEKLKNILYHIESIPMNKIDVIPHGSQELFLHWMKDTTIEDTPSILHFGRIEEYKGIQYLIKAEPLVSEKIPNVKFILAGRGDKLNEYVTQVVNQDKYEILNYYIPHEQVAELFQRASIVVLPYIDASQSGIVPMAYAFKKPVIVTDVGSIPEVVDDGVTGLIIPPKNHTALANAIIKLLRDEELRKRMGINAYEKMKVDMSWEKIAKETIKSYEMAIKS